MSATPVSHTAAELPAVLAEERYLRSRLRPRLRDRDFLILSDVLAVVRRFAVEVQGRLFDYGSGGAPYQSLFVRCHEYIRADVLPGPKVDRLISFDGKTGEASNSYDAILSTQVLEHVAHPAAYLEECYRMLKSGGQVLITTHGMFEEHGCPYDFTRWTAVGLEQLVRNAGFEIVSSYKICTQIRGALQLENCFGSTLRSRENRFYDLLGRVIRKLQNIFLTPCLNWLGARLPHQAVVPGNDLSWLYVGVAVHARKVT